MALGDSIAYIGKKVDFEYGEDEQSQRDLVFPSMLPDNSRDRTYQAWLQRLSLVWGTLIIKYTDPENKIKNQTINQEKFISIITDPQDIKVYGSFIMEQVAVNKVIFYRKEVGYDFRNYKKVLEVEVKLKDNLQKALDNFNRKGIWGWLFK